MSPEQPAQPIIEVSSVAKRYRLFHGPMYETFRDTVAELMKRPFTRRSAKTPRVEDFWALRDINFTVPAGQRLGIIGRNGAGKSTLLKILSRITPPTQGTVTLRGRVASLLEVGTGFHAELTGRENIFLNGAILGMSQAEIRSKFDEIVDFADISQFLDTPVKRYSSGMYVRLAFAVAAHLEPEILIVDEVLAVGDYQFQQKCLGKMQDVARSGRTILFVSHNLGAIKQLCDRCLLLTNGRITSDGNPQDVIRDYLTTHAMSSSAFEQQHAPAKKMNLRRVSLLRSQNGQPNVVAYDDKVVIDIEYEINQPVTNALVWCYIQSLDGIMPFTSGDYDLHPELRNRREVGYYRSRLTIPGRWLNTGAYLLTVCLNTNNPVVSYDRVEALQFDVIDNGTTPKSVFNETIRGGVFQPYLDWQTARLSPSAQPTHHLS